MKEKYHVFSVRATEEGLRPLNKLKCKKEPSWDGLVLDVACTH